jgi:hypothetical protein
MDTIPLTVCAPLASDNGFWIAPDPNETIPDFARPSSPEKLMRPSLAAAFALFVLSANANAQVARVVPLSFEAAARAGISSRATNPSSGVRAVESNTNIAGHASVARGAVIGFAVGFITGATVAALSIKGNDKESKQLRWVAVVANGLLGGVIGGVAGAFIASRDRSKDSMPLIPAPSR